MRVLVVADSYVPLSVFRAAFDGLDGADVDWAEADADDPSNPEPGIREYAGTAAHVADLVSDHEVLVVHGAPVTAAVLDAAPNLRLVCCARGGPVNVDVAEAASRGIAVVTTPGKNAEAVADLTLAFLVMLARGIPRASRFLADGGRMGDSAFEGAEFFGHDLAGLTLGLVGYGHVGRRVAVRARAFGMPVLVHDPYLEDGAEVDGTCATLDDLLARSDAISLHARATPENEDLIDRDALARMREGAVLVNTARETLVDEEALLEALRSGRLAGAALDVVRPRPDGSRNPLLDLGQVVMTPHIGGATAETLARGAEMLADELGRWSAGELPVNVADRSALEGRADP